MLNENFDYDLFVIGAGSGGVRAARLAAHSGAKVAIAEKYRIGGTCVIRGCIPKKFLSYSSKFSKHNIVAKSFGWEYNDANFSWKSLIKNKDKQIQKLSLIYQTNMENSGVRIIKSSANIIDNHTIVLDDKKKYSAKKILIATGAKPFFPKINGIEHVISSDDFFDLKDLPSKVIIVGGGYIALEFASIISGLGSKCELIYRGDKLLKNFDADISEIILKELQSNKLSIKLNTNVTEISKVEDHYKLKLDDGTFTHSDIILYATGRHPDIECLNSNGMIKTDTYGRIIVNKSFQTSIPNIYAIGDVSNNYQLTPVAIREAMIFVRNEFEKQDVKYKIENIPTAVFSNPEIGTVGMTENEALLKYKKIDIYTSTFRSLYYTLTDLTDKTFIKMLVDNKSQKLLGFHMIGDDAAEIAQLMSVLINKNIKKSDLDNTIPLHPTTAEEIMTMRNKITKEL
ncbi:MAG: glutathione-disulfide reductase [Hyphomicrobiales bacterium]|mgnify:FL=1|nr:glutathione-disulfide reductase [Hyphomicrobiales bacterium]